MRRMTYFVMAMALVLGLTQCKKEQSVTPVNEGVKITLNVNDSDNNGSRAEVDPPHVNFVNGDQILVASGGKYVGLLTRDNGVFTGNISDPVEDEKLYFYFLGNKQDNETLTAGTTTSCTVNISDQTAELPVISMGKSTENYSADVTSYSSRLYNKASLMKFVVNTPSKAAICITSMNNKVTVDFGDPEAENRGFTYGQENSGLIKMPAKNGENVTWAIVLPQNAIAAGAEGSAYTDELVFTGTRPAIAAIEVNNYYDEGIEMEVKKAPEGAISSLFSISDNQQVLFSKGNIQYQASTNTWRFALNQWNYVGGYNYETNNGSYLGNVYEGFNLCHNENLSQTYSGWIDLFGWGTSGYNHGAVCYQPWSKSQTHNNYNVYGSLNKNLYDESGQADWGYNPISNGGNTENIGWRTLTKAEWKYLLEDRTDANLKIGHGKVNNRVYWRDPVAYGLILLPDTWTLPEGLSFTPGNSDWANEYSTDQWAQMEANGAVFLPAARYRYAETRLNPYVNGYYWSSTVHPTDGYCAYSGAQFGGNYVSSQVESSRGLGYSVRLVRNYIITRK